MLVEDEGTNSLTPMLWQTGVPQKRTLDLDPAVKNVLLGKTHIITPGTQL